MTDGASGHGDLDPVDLARMAASMAGKSPGHQRSRYGVLIAMIAVLVVMMVAGMLFAARLHPASGTGAGVISTASPVMAPSP